MALPIILLFTLLGAAGILLYLGTRTYSVFNGALLLSLSGTLIIVTGLMLMTAGLELDNTKTIVDDNSGTYTINYDILPPTDSAVSTLANLLTYGGIIPILLALVFTIIHVTSEYSRKSTEWQV